MTAEPYQPSSVASVVRWGAKSGQLDRSVEGNTSLVFDYNYWANCSADGEGYTYHSPIIHHVQLTGLEPGRTYFYSVGEQRHYRQLHLQKQPLLRVHASAWSRPARPCKLLRHRRPADLRRRPPALLAKRRRRGARVERGVELHGAGGGLPAAAGHHWRPG